MSEPLWKKRQRHDIDLRAIHVACGHYDSSGRLRSFYGPKFQAALAKSAHSQGRFDGCKCARAPEEGSR